MPSQTLTETDLDCSRLGNDHFRVELAAKSLRVDPTELNATAESLDTHSESFSATHEQAHSRAGQVAFGTSKAAAALPGMLANDPTEIFSQGIPTTVVDSGKVPQPYGGFIMPGSTLDNMSILASQWNAADPVNPGWVYNSQQITVNVNRPP